LSFSVTQANHQNGTNIGVLTHNNGGFKVTENVEEVMMLIEKAKRIYASDSPPEKNESFACKWCRHGSICSGADWARSNCRTCIHFSFGAAAGKCAAHNIELTPEKELAGCEDHRWIPSLVPGEQFDFSAEGTKISYRLTNGTVFIDGDGFKPAAPEVEQ
jgi:hypothetical protein